MWPVAERLRRASTASRVALVAAVMDLSRLEVLDAGLASELTVRMTKGPSLLLEDLNSR
jgi:hypothetical protein